MGSEFATGDVSVTVGGDACVIDAGAGTTTTQITCASAAKAAGSHAVVVTNTVTSGASNSDVVVTYGEWAHPCRKDNIPDTLSPPCFVDR